jgi:CubicO group peptidase (beta-lactamase class C family)
MIKRLRGATTWSENLDNLLSQSAGSSSRDSWESRGWGFGVSMVTRCDGVSAVPGRFGWDGGCGTSSASDPRPIRRSMTERRERR